MARTKQIPTYPSVKGKMWEKNWNKIPRREKTIEALKHALVRYPKTPKSLKKIIVTLFEIPCDHANISLWRRLFSKYKNLMDSYLDFSLMQPVNEDDDFPKILQPFKTRFKEEDEYEETQITEGINLRGRRIRVVEACSKTICNDPHTFFSQILQYRKHATIKHLFMDSIPLFSLNEYRRLLFASQNHLQHLALDGPLAPDFKTQNFIQLIRLSLQLPCLKSFRFNVRCPEDFSVNDFPFDILQKRKINFDVRVSHFAESLSEQTVVCLSDLEYLAINTIDEFIFLAKTNFEDQIQKGLSRLLFLNVSSQTSFDTSRLFEACQNISVLHLNLDGTTPIITNFTKLRELPNLKHLILRLQGWNPFFQDLFDSLASQAREYQTLRTLVLKFNVKEWGADLTPFFEACAETVQEVILQVFNCQNFTAFLDSFYEYFRKIQNLTSLSLEFYKWESPRSSQHQNGFLYFTEKLFSLIHKQTQLEKLKIYLSFQVEFKKQTEQIALHLPPSIRDFHLHLNHDLSVFRIEQLLDQATKLEKLALQTDLSPVSFEKLLKSFVFLQELETLELQLKADYLREFQALRVPLPKLRFIKNYRTVFVKRIGLWKVLDEIIE